MRWYVGGFAVTALLVLSLFSIGPLAFAAIAGVLLLVLFITMPKAGAGIAVLSILFGAGLPTMTGVSALSYLDESMVALSLVTFVFVRLLQGKMLRRLPGLGWIAVYLIAGTISSYTHDVPTLLAAQSSFLILKGFVFAFAVAQLDWNREDVKRMAKVGAWALVAVLVASVINLAIPETWAHIFSRRDKGVDYRLGLPSLIGPFDHEFAYGEFMAISAVAILAYRSHIQKGVASAVLLAGSMVGLILSFRRKAIGAAVVALLSVRLWSPGKRMSAAVVTILVLPIVAIVAWDSISELFDATYTEYFADPTKAARTRLYTDGFGLAAQNFPLGVGFARFGSYMASQVYSPEYAALGYPAIYGLAPGIRGPYLSDTFWPAIVAEAGYIGLIAFALALVSLTRVGTKLVKATEDPYLRWAGIVAAAWMIEFVVESIAAPSFNTPPVYTLLFFAGGLATSLMAQQPALPTVAPEPVRKTSLRR